MKFFAAIMVVILLAQSFMPCADKSCISSKESSSINQASHQQKDVQDDCPPLCGCTCCSSFSSTHSFTSCISIHIFNSANPKAEFIPSAIQKIALPVWQPPQLA